MADIFASAVKFPYERELNRLARYHKYGLLLDGDHFDAFRIAGGKDFSQQYERIRYVVANFDGLIAKVSADILFGEEVQINVDKNQDWIDRLYFMNRLKTQFFESAMSNAGLGDAVFKIRTQDEEIKIEDANPALYFPHYNPGNPRRVPEVEELAWVREFGEDKDKQYFLIRELHSPGKVETKIFKLKRESDDRYEIGLEVSVEEYNNMSGENLAPEVDTKISRNLLIHVPNYKTRGHKSFFGTSDFIDTETLQFALNNRVTKNENVLDKHSDPIIAVPPGVLDEDGNVKKEAFHMIEIPEGETGQNVKPEYIVWNANLDAAFKQIDKLMEFLYMVSEVSPDVLGMGKGGQAESGRALKMRMLRTIAKRNRKRLYYDQAITEMIEIAQELSIEAGYKIDGERLTGKMETPQITWSDGIVDDVVEQTEVAVQQTEAELKSRKTAIMEINGFNEAEAEKELEQIDKERGSFDAFGTASIDNNQPPQRATAGAE